MEARCDDLCIPKMRKAYIGVESLANKFLKDLELTASQSIAVFALLERQEEGGELMTQRDLENYMAMSNPAVTGIVNRLEEKGFIRRVKRGDDHRSNYIEPTEKSLEMHKKLYPRLVKSEDIIFAGFSEEEKKLFCSFMERMTENVAEV